jgi:hypothetical protein
MSIQLNPFSQAIDRLHFSALVAVSMAKETNCSAEVQISLQQAEKFLLAARDEVRLQVIEKQSRERKTKKRILKK